MYQCNGAAFGSFVIALRLWRKKYIFTILCAQYESWSILMGIILAVPLALLGTVAAVILRSMDVNVYTQIGIVLLIALASKNAILIVEFAKEKRESGMGILEAAAEAARLRFRPILMTSFSFVLGTFPLVVAQGAGAAAAKHWEPPYSEG